MERLVLAEIFELIVCKANSLDQLFGALSECTHEMGFRYFALSQHVDFGHGPNPGIRLHNYPSLWGAWFDERALGRFDPIHRASHMTRPGFNWSHVPAMIQLTIGDQDVLRAARQAGIGDGFTVPAHAPGEYNGSCSFAVRDDERFPAGAALSSRTIGPKQRWQLASATRHV